MTTSESAGEQAPEDGQQGPEDGERKQEDDTALLVAALDHSWTWYDEHMKRVFQLINFFIVATALLATAYANSINKKQYGFAVALAVVGLVLLAVASVSALNQAEAAARADEPLCEMQDRIALRLEVGRPKADSFRMVQYQKGLRYTAPAAAIIIVLAALLFIAALTYAATR
jgi:hypothetical protein